jgi:hypothetical protein
LLELRIDGYGAQLIVNQGSADRCQRLAGTVPKRKIWGSTLCHIDTDAVRMFQAKIVLLVGCPRGKRGVP